MLAQARTTAVIVIPDDDDLAICHLTQLMGMSDALQCCVTDPMKFGVGENRVVLPHVP